MGQVLIHSVMLFGCERSAFHLEQGGLGAVAQLGERLVRNEEVSGSIPLSSTIESIP